MVHDRLGPKIERNHACKSLAHAIVDVVRRNNEILARIVLAAKHYMRMRDEGVEMVRSNSLECRSKILLHEAHEASDQGPKLIILGRVLGSDDEPEMMPVPGAAFNKGPAVRTVLGCRI